VVIIPITRNHELVLIRQFRPSLDSYVIELPAGLVDPEEDLVSAGRRSLLRKLVIPLIPSLSLRRGLCQPA